MITETLVEQKYDVIGHGEMIDRPCQKEAWWCVPFDEYKGYIPPEALEKKNQILKSDEKVVGFIVADDIRNVQEQLEVKPRFEWEKIVATGVMIVGGVILGIAILYILLPLVMVALFIALLVYDPMLIAVTEDGRWLCLHTWWDEPLIG
jgi:hypothetical protein